MAKTTKTVTITKENFGTSDVTTIAFTAGHFGSTILIDAKEYATIDAKSILGFFVLGLKTGDTFTISAEGEDAEKAIETLEELIK